MIDVLFWDHEQSRRGRAVILVVATAMIMAGPYGGLAAAARRASDAKSAGKYLQALHAVVRHETLGFAGAERAAHWLQATARHDCAAVLTGAPSGQQRDTVTTEIVGAVFAELAHPYRRLLRTYAQRIGHLRWSTVRMSDLVRDEAREERTVARLAVPMLCRDARFWADSGFQLLPHATYVFVARFERISRMAPVQTAIMKEIVRFGTPAQKVLLQKTSHLQNALAERAGRVWSADIGGIAEALGLDGP